MYLRVLNNFWLADIIAFEVIFSIVLFLVIASCYAVAIRRRRRKKREAARLHALLPVCTDSMLERAYARNERPIHSIIQGDPPPYSPPDSTLRLPNHAVTRLSNALLRAHTTTMQERPTSSLQPSMLTSDFPPKYSDLQSTAVDERRDSLQSMLRAPSSNHNDENNTDERHPSCYTTTTGLSNSNQQRTRWTVYYTWTMYIIFLLLNIYGVLYLLARFRCR